MTYDQDPARWSTDPDEAPELLRGAFSAGRNEGPSRTQMRSLAVKLAAASAGGAVAVGTVKAASAGNTLTTAMTWSAAKVASVVVLAGSVVTGAVIWSSSSPDAPSDHTTVSMQAPADSADDSIESAPQPNAAAQHGRTAAAPARAAGEVPAQPTATPQVGTSPTAPAGASSGQPAGATVELVPHANTAAEAPAGAAAANARADVTSPRTDTTSAHAGATSAPAVANTDSRGSRSADAEPASSPRTGVTAQRKPAERSGTASTPARVNNPRTARIVSVPGVELPPPSEVSLLRNAQVALQSRPREAFQLTQQHRRLYPAGEFAQERDALAIQALMRAGETDQARDLAQAFIRAYPTSPHAHRFREAMGIR